MKWHHTLLWSKWWHNCNEVTAQVNTRIAFFLMTPLSSSIYFLCFYAAALQHFHFELNLDRGQWVGNVLILDGPRLRPPDADGKGGGFWACCQQHCRRRPGQALVAQEPQLWGEMLHFFSLGMTIEGTWSFLCPVSYFSSFWVKCQEFLIIELFLFSPLKIFIGGGVVFPLFKALTLQIHINRP